MKKMLIIFASLLLFTYSFELYAQEYNSPLKPVIVSNSKDFIEQISDTAFDKDTKHTNNISQISGITTTNIVANMLNHIKHPWTDPYNVYIIHANQTSKDIKVRLFDDGVKLDMDVAYLNDYPEYAVSFILDNFWGRIIYAQRRGGWIKSYGNHDGDFNFSDPRGFTLDINDSIYAVDCDKSNIIKLWFDRNDNGGTVKFSSNFTIPSLSHPIDLAIDQSGSLSGYPMNDKIWILDDFTNQIICIRRSGVVSQRITSYTNGTGVFPLTNVSKIQTQEVPGGTARLGFIDKNLMAFIIIQPPSNSIIAITPFDPAISDLSCIGLDVNNEWWVGDEKMKLYHHFSKDGQYIASYSNSGTPSGEFSSPVAITKAPYYKYYSSIHRGQYIFTSDLWGSTTGMRTFLPGASIMNPPTNISGNYLSILPIGFMLTNRAYIKAKIAKYDYYEWKVFKEFDPVAIEANTNAEYKLDNLFMGTGAEFRIYLEYCPAYIDPADWEPTGSVSIPVYNNKISSYNIINIVPVSPTPLCTAVYGYYEAKPLYNGPFTYTWYRNRTEIGNGKIIRISEICPGTILKCVVKYTDPGTDINYSWEGEYTNCPMSVTINGPYTLLSGQSGTWVAAITGNVQNATIEYRWSYQPLSATTWTYLPEGPTLNWTMGSESFRLKSEVIVATGVGCAQTATSTIIVRLGTPPPSCPYVYTWDGNSFQEDNNILPQSEYEFNAGKDVTDYYRLLKPLKLKNNKYILQIREFENEKSYLDKFELFAVDHPEVSKIDVAPSSGEIYHYITPFRLKEAKHKNKNYLAELSQFDSSRITVNPGDTIRVTIRQSSSKSSPYSISATLPGGEEGGGDLLPKVSKAAQNAHQRNLAGLDGILSFRQRPTLVFVPTVLDSTNSLNIVWSQKARLDYLNYGIIISTPYNKIPLQLVSASHSTQGDVIDKLSSLDSNYAVLSPSEFIELQFEGLPLPSPGTERSYILCSRGRYEHLPDSTDLKPNLNNSISEFMIDEIYPNPFNPITKISYQQPADGYTKIIIYDMLGREVTVLANEMTSAGIHEVIWNAMNLSSGIYFCRFTVTNSVGRVLHQEVKKLILTR